MKTLVYTSALGLICMLAEMLNLRKWVLPICVAGLAVILALNFGTGWGVNQGFYQNMILVDNYSVAFSGLLIMLGILILILSGNFYKNEQSKLSDYLAILIFTLCGGIALVSFGNLVMFFLGLEVLSISLYILAGSKRKDIRSNEAGMKYFLMGSFASGILLFGIALIYGETGTFDVYEIARLKAQVMPGAMFYIGAGMIMMALFFKVSAAPFHFWAPDVYEGSPTLITLTMATLAKIAAFGAFYRLFSTCFLPAMQTYAWVFSAVTALTLAIGNFTALQQDSFKRLLAFSGISHAGYLMMAILSVYGNSANALFYYALAYGLTSVAAFAIAIVVASNAQSEKIDAFNGLGKTKPWLAGALTLAMLSMAGIPPFAGFFGKYYVFTEAVKTGHVYITIFAVVNSIVAVYYYFKVVLAMYTKEPAEVAFTVKPSYTFVIGVCVLLILLIGIFPSAFASLL
ncbi:MAG TPA: NADH-quinone oxidoreductase subunit N [Chitinophagales bacterium]|nr:NADH-quinone oxidoreductase subunit N [Chitinophagales bacterium]